jgi:hypothetical protein
MNKQESIDLSKLRQNKYIIPIIEEISRNEIKVVSIEPSLEQDKIQGCDLILEVQSPGKIQFACRLRYNKKVLNDFTFRVRRYGTTEPNERYSEYYKIARDQVSWDRYFYGNFNTTTQQVTQWYIFDRRISIDSNIFNRKRTPLWVDQQSGFIPIPIYEFEDCGAILYSYDKKGEADKMLCI